MIAVWFSCGAASAVALEETLLRYGHITEVRAINNPVVEEHPDNLRFLQDVATHLGCRIELAVARSYPSSSAEDVWKHRRYMAGVGGAPCTTQLKKIARQEWEEENNPRQHVFGFTLDERSRYERFILTERENVLPVLIDAQLTKQDCFERVKSWGIDLPKIYSYGFKNANCIGCVKSLSPAYWNLVRKEFPEVFARRAKLSREIGARLIEKTTAGTKRRYFLDELPESWGRDEALPAAPECGIICEEK